jgi:hypothetical protein
MPDLPRGGAHGERGGGAEQDRADQAPSLHDVAQRHHEREACDVADLRAGDEQPGGAVGDAQRVCATMLSSGWM